MFYASNWDTVSNTRTPIKYSCLKNINKYHNLNLIKLLELTSGLHKKTQGTSWHYKETATPIKTVGLFLKITRFLH